MTIFQVDGSTSPLGYVSTYQRFSKLSLIGTSVALKGGAARDAEIH